MSILDKAQELADKEREARSAETKHEEESRQRRRELVDLVKSKVLALLLTEVHDRRGFTIDQDNPGMWGAIGRLRHNGQTLGVIKVEGEDYTFDGSDECRNIPAWHVVIQLATTERQQLAHSSVSHVDDLEQGLQKFSDSLAEYLKRFLV